MSDSLVLTERRGPVLLIRINRPEVKNAVDAATARAIEAAIDQLDEDNGLFLGIITGTGGVFCAGADLKAAQAELDDGTPRQILARGGFGVFRRPPRKPLIAAVEGYGVGGGLELALSCDLIVAAETARFGLPEVRHNVVAVGGGLFRLPRRIPYHIAMEMALTGQPRDAAFLERWGLVNRLVPEGEAVDRALELAETMLVNGPTALAAAKEIIFRSASWSTEDEAWEAQKPIAEIAMRSDDRKEGVAAFLERRKPVWKGY